jgi:hypothetical protein
VSSWMRPGEADHIGALGRSGTNYPSGVFIAAGAGRKNGVVQNGVSTGRSAEGPQIAQPSAPMNSGSNPKSFLIRILSAVESGSSAGHCFGATVLPCNLVI